MKLFHITAFDETVSGTSSTWYSLQSEQDRLALADSLVMQAVATNVTGTTPGLVVRVQHSADGQNWVNVQPGGPEIGGTSTTDTVGTDLTAGVFYGAVPGLSNAMLAYTRLRVTLTGTSPQCRLKIIVTGRKY